ncbi:MAG: AI-2E family transporter [Fimbriimonadales bacterium]
MAVVLAAIWFFYAVRSILFPFAVGLVVAALLDPSIRGLRTKGVSRRVAVGTIYALFFASAAAIGILVAPLVSSQVRKIQTNVTNFIRTSLFPETRLENFLRDPATLEARMRMEEPFPLPIPEFQGWIKDPARKEEFYADFFTHESARLYAHNLPGDRRDLIESLETPVEPGWLDRNLSQYKPTLERLNLPTSRSGMEEMFKIKQNVSKIASNAFAGSARIVQYLTSSVFLLILTPIITLLILLDYDNFRRRFVTWIPPTIRPAATDLLADLGDVLSAYVRGLTKSVLLYSAINAALLTILGVPYSMFLGLLVGVFYLIPYIGNFISVGVIWLALLTTDSRGFLFVEFGSKTTYMGVVLGTFLIVGILYDQFVHPRIVGRSVGLHPVVSFFVILSGSALFGLAGMILAFPIAGMVKVILDRLIRYTTTLSTDALELPRVPRRHLA